MLSQSLRRQRTMYGMLIKKRPMLKTNRLHKQDQRWISGLIPMNLGSGGKMRFGSLTQTRFFKNIANLSLLSFKTQHDNTSLNINQGWKSRYSEVRLMS